MGQLGKVNTSMPRQRYQRIEEVGTSNSKWLPVSFGGMELILLETQYFNYVCFNHFKMKFMYCIQYVGQLFYVEHVISAMCRVVRDPSTSSLAHWGYKEVANIIKLLKNGVDGFERDEVVNSITISK